MSLPMVQPVGNPQPFSFKETVSNLVKNKYLMIITLIMFRIEKKGVNY